MRRIVVADEPALDVWPKISHYATLDRVWDPDRGVRVVQKRIMPWRFKGMDAAERKSEVLLVNNSTNYYRSRLRSRGVPLSAWYHCSNAENEIVHTAPYLGLSLDQLFGRIETGVDCLSVLEKVLESIQGLIEQRYATLGLDAQLANFCLQDGRALYIDVFPPLFQCPRTRTYFVHYPNPTDVEILKKEVRRKFTARGILRRLRFSVLQVDPRLEKYLLEAIRNVLAGALRRQVCEYFEKLPDNTVGQDERSLLKAINRLTLMDTDTAREMALKLLPFRERMQRNEREERARTLAQIFDLSSSFSAHDVPGDERLASLKTLLQSLACRYAVRKAEE